MTQLHIAPALAAGAALPRFLPVHEVTRILGISRQSLYAWMSSGHFPRGTKIGPRRIGWLESDVMAWVQAKTAA